MYEINNKKFYNNAIKRFGVTPQGVHWNSKYSQYTRFEIITSCIQNELETSVIIDAGCGFGEYYNYLLTNNQKVKHYIGIDCEENMINIAKQRFPQTEFYVQDVLIDSLKKADYYVCSGALNLLNEEAFYYFILQAWNSSKKGFVFNFLKEESFNHITVSEVLEFCNKLTNKIEIHDQYLKNDMTIFLQH